MFEAVALADPLESLALHDRAAGTHVTIAPSRGGLVTRFEAHGREVFFLDEGTLRDETKNVRGGNPVLFPQPGKLAGDVFSRGALKQHGFARNAAWQLAGTDTSEAAKATLRWVSSDATRSAYPWDFTVELDVVLRDAVLRLGQRVTNTGTEPMPFGFGFHPYFRVADAAKADARLETPATRAFDNVSKSDVPIAGPIDLTASEVDLHLHDHGAVPLALRWPDGHVIVRGSPEYTHWVVWTVRGKDYVCVEPWTCPGNALNSGDRLLTLAPGETRALWVEYEAVR